MLPFSREQFIAIFVQYNAAVWPAQAVAYVLALVMLAMIVRPSRSGDRVIAAGLALMWIWTGVAYHGLHFSTINKAALAFGALFVLQGFGLLYAGLAGRLGFGARSGLAAWLGWALVIYATLLYPLAGLWAGHRLPGLPMFGITPCPVTIFSFGLLLLATPPVPRWLLVVPLVCSLIGGSAAILLGVPQDWLLLFSGLAVVAVLHGQRSAHIQAPALT
jgi:hypothetical protein